MFMYGRSPRSLGVGGIPDDDKN